MTEDDIPTGYADLLHLIDILPDLVREKRRRESLSLRQAGDEIDLSFSTIDRFENREADPSLRVLKTLITWVAT